MCDRPTNPHFRPSAIGSGHARALGWLVGVPVAGDSWLRPSLLEGATCAKRTSPGGGVRQAVLSEQTPMGPSARSRPTT